MGSGETKAKAETTAKGSRIRLPRRKGQRDDDNTGEVPLLALPVATATPSPPAAAQSAQSQPASPSVRAASVGTVALAEPVGYARADWGAIDPDRAAEPQWDAERGSYVQFDVESWRWMIYVHEEELWRSLG